jgi:hypothetical protein
LLLEFEDEFELELLLEFDDEFELELLLEFEDEFELELLFEFEDELEFELELLFELERPPLSRAKRRERASCHVTGRSDVTATASATTPGIPPGSRFWAGSACAARAPPTVIAATAVVNFMVLDIPDSILL